MELETYKTVTFKDRLMQALEQIREMDKDIEKRIPLRIGHEMESENDKFLKQCLDKLHDSQDTLLTLRKEILFYISG